MPPELQTTLLGAIERRRFCRVGGHEEIAVDVRVVAATNRDLRSEVNAGSFRLDLYYRLAVVTLEVPPLRDRTEDIPGLVEHFLEEEGFGGRAGELVPAAVMQRLKQHRWPGNVRELKNFVQATLAMGEPVALHDALEAPRVELASMLERFLPLPYAEARAKLVAEFEAVYVRRLLEQNDGNVARAARNAQVARSHLNELLRRHGLR